MSYLGNGGTCAIEAQRRVNALVSAQTHTQEVTWAAPAATQQLTVAGTTATVFNTTTPDGLALIPVVQDVYVASNQRVEVSFDFQLFYQTVGSVVTLAKTGPVTPYQGSPFMIEHAVIRYDVATSNEIVEALTYELLPFGSYYPAAAGTYVALGHGMFTAQGTKAVATIEGTERTHRFSLVWALEATDWNQTAPSAGGWEVEAFAQVFSNPPGSTTPTVAVDVPNMLTMTARFFPRST